MVDRVICRVYSNKKSKQLLVCIPKKSGYKYGDYVEIIEVKNAER